MFKPQISVTLARKPKTRKDDTIDTETSEIDWEQIAKTAQETSKTIGKTVAVAYVAKKLVDTACQIAVIAAQAKL